MVVLKAVLDKYPRTIDTCFTANQRTQLLSVLRDSFLCDSSDDDSDAELQRRKDIVQLIALFAGSSLD